MIQATELRVGNLVYNDNVIEPVIWNSLGFENTPYNPIPLTEEWMYIFGFYSDILNEGDEPVYLSEKYPDFYIDFKTLQPIDGGFQIAKFEIKYIHQLQNLYFALTNKELIIKQ